MYCVIFQKSIDLISCFFVLTTYLTGAHGGIVVKALCTNRQVTGSIPNGVLGILQSHNPSGHTMTLGSTQPLSEISTRCISWG
jgi:hypothetical protein